MQRWFGSVSDCAQFRKQDVEDISELEKATEDLRNSGLRLLHLLKTAADDDEHPLHGNALQAAKPLHKVAKATRELYIGASVIADVAADEPNVIEQWRCWTNTQRGQFWRNKARQAMEDD